MTPLKVETVATYNNSAEALAKKFDAIGARKEDIDYVFSMQDKKDPYVLEIGCGNGRDAKEILKHTSNYHGIDISENLIAIAKNNLPNVRFDTADTEEYEFENSIDIVFAFASLIHVDKESFRKTLEKIYAALNENGLVFISLKYSKEYEQVTKTDEFGTRTYWHYSQGDIESMLGDFKLEHTTIQEKVGQIWIDVLLRK